MSQTATQNPRPSVHSRRFVKLFQSELLLLLDLDLTLVQVRVLAYLIAKGGYGNSIPGVQIVAVARKLKHDRTTVSRALKTLETMGLIRRTVDADSPTPRIDLNPWLVFKGNSYGRAAAIADNWVRPKRAS
jgi:hypothetical protein